MTENVFEKIEPNYRYTPHIILVTVIFVFQYFSKAKEVNSNLDPAQKKVADKLFWKYMIVFQIAKAADWCLGPFVFEFYEKYHHLKADTIAKMIATSFMSGLFLGPTLVGYLNDKSDKKFPCILYGVVLSISCIVRQIRSPLAIIMAQIFFGMSSSILYSSFENWFVSESNRTITNKNVKEYLFSAAFEKSMIGDSITAVGVSMVAGILRKQYGVQTPYMFCVIICMISIITTGILLTSIEHNDSETKTPKDQHNFIDVFRNINESLAQCRRSPFIILIGLTESLLLATLHIFIFMWTPIIREMNPEADTSEIFTLFMMSLMLGGSAFRVIKKYLFIGFIFYFRK
jgi:MFS family permease